MFETLRSPGLGSTVRRHEHFVLFDYLRMVLALGVFFAHSNELGLLPKNLGHACVSVFFALSGFLIGGILLASTPKDLPRFYFNRCTRIWVPYAIAIVLLFVVTALRQDLRDAKLWEFFFYKATFVYNVFGPPQLATAASHMPLQGTGNHFWSICVEEQFYLVAPFLIMFARRLRVPILVALVALNTVTPHAFSSVALGVLLALSRHRFGDWHLTRAGTVATVAVLFVSVFVFWRWPATYVVAIGPAATAVVALAARPGAVQPLGTWLGGMSYPFYLNHWLGLFVRNPLARLFHLGPVATSGVALAVALAIAAAHYGLVDRYIHARRSTWFTPRRGVTACVTAIALVLVGLLGGVALR